MTPEQEVELARRYEAGNETVTALAAEYGVVRQSVPTIVRRVKRTQAEQEGDAA